MRRRLQVLLRIAALGCILASVPLDLVTFPWLPATVLTWAQRRHDPAPWGTPSYHADRERVLDETETALVLYAMAIVSLCALAAIVAHLGPGWLRALGWAVTAVTAFRVATFQATHLVGTETLASYTLIAVRVPLGIAIVSCAGAVLTLVSPTAERSAGARLQP